MSKKHVVIGLLLFLFSFAGVKTPGFVNINDFPTSNGVPFSFIKKVAQSEDNKRPTYTKPNLKVGQHHVALVRFSSDVNQYSAAAFIDALDQVNKAKAEYIVLELNSPGGSVAAGFEMSLAMEKSNATVICVVDGMAASMGYFLLQSCDIRLMTKRSQLMIHEPKIMGAEVSGGQTEIHNLYELMHALTEAMIEQFAQRTVISVPEMRERIKDGKEWWVNWEEALSTKMVDGTVQNSKLVYLALLNGAKLPVHQAN